MPDPTRALVTGATGFVGSRLARRLVAEGWEVHALVRPGSDLAELGPAAGSVRVHLLESTTAEAAAFPRLLDAAAPDVIFHVAALTSSGHRHEDVRPLLESNVTFPALLLDAAAASGVRHVVNTGTSWTHFGNSAYDPVCLYAATKKAFEDILRYYVSAAGVRAVTLELFDTYGPADPRQKLMSLLRDAARTRSPLDVTPGEQLVDLVHVDDVVQAYLLAALRLRAGLVEGLETYAVSSGRPLVLREVAALYERVSGRALNLRWGGRAYRDREVMVPWSGGRPLPGWSPAVGLEAGMRQVAAEGGGA